LLDAARPRAVWRGAVPSLAPWIAIAFLTAFVLASTEFSVCHLCQLQTLNTEILAEFQVAPARALTLAWPFIALIALSAAGLALFHRRLVALLTALGDLNDPVAALRGPTAAPRTATAVLLIAVIALLAPWALLLAQMRDPTAFLRVWSTFPRAWPMGLVQAAVAAAAAGILAVSADAVAVGAQTGKHRLRRPAVWAARLIDALLLMLALLPPALVGIAFLRTYASQPWMSDTLLIVSATNVARFGALALLAVRLASASGSEALLGAARTEGAGWLAGYWPVRGPRILQPALSAMVMVGLLALSEVAATVLVNPPAMPNLALTLLNHIHFARNDEVIALCLSLMVLVALLSAGLIAARRRSR
jgi:ABC-type Fe3+ transport system permease subunit